MSNETDPYAAILNHYGAPAQLVKFGEECAEVAAIIQKYIHMKLVNPAADTADVEKEICSEVADVENLLPQVRMILDTAEIDRIRQEKIKRTFERM